jgi:hypothetical protein
MSYTSGRLQVSLLKGRVDRRLVISSEPLNFNGHAFTWESPLATPDDGRISMHVEHKVFIAS